MQMNAAPGRQDIQPVFMVDSPEADEVAGHPATDSTRPCRVRASVSLSVNPNLDTSRNKALRQPTLSPVISPSAFISPLAEIGNGAIIAPFCSIQARSSIWKMSP